MVDSVLQDVGLSDTIVTFALSRLRKTFYGLLGGRHHRMSRSIWLGVIGGDVFLISDFLHLSALQLEAWSDERMGSSAK